MKKTPTIMAFAAALLIATTATAADLSSQTPIKVEVKLGSKGGELVFEPNQLSFQAGKLYKLVIENPSPNKHYFSALRFASAVWTRKVEADGVEIKGSVREIEVKPGGEAEWFFVPVKTGSFDLECTIPGHADAGMVGTIRID